MGSPATVEQLKKRYPDEEWRGRYVELCDLMDLLSECIIAHDYHIPSELSEAISLTDHGKALMDKLIRKEQVPVPEARLMCALAVGHVELLVDPMLTNIRQLESSIGKQIRAGELVFPFTHGRQMYDRFADLFPDEKDLLSYEETQQLLADSPVGVFQHGVFVTGPLGLERSQTSRYLAASRLVPAFHCADPVCVAVHTSRLTTSPDATINKHRDKARRLLDAESKHPSEWWAFMREIAGYTNSFFADASGGSIAHLIGDSLSDRELAILVEALIDGKKSKLRETLPELCGSGSAKSIVSTVSSPTLLQMVLLCPETEVAKTLDSLVRTKRILVPEGEVRTPVTNIRAKSGAFRLTAQLGSLGLRYLSNDRGLASLRLRRLLRNLYVQNIDTDSEELEWQLRGFEAAELDDRLEEFFRTVDPESALRRLVLARKTNMVAACVEVGIEDAESMDDDQLISSILWKLGFNVRAEFDPNKRFWELHDRMIRLSNTSRISGMGDSETFRGVATEYFRELEGVLDDSLSFATFVLLGDHIATDRPFQYEVATHSELAMRLLQNIWTRTGAHEEVLKFVAGKNSLHTLFRGFGVLATELERLETERESSKKSNPKWPDYRGKTSLKDFIFEHECAFLDLTENSRHRLSAKLRTVSSDLISAKVNEVRNEFHHYRRTDPEIELLTTALTASGKVVRDIESVGLSRILHWPDRVEIDAWGRSNHSFVGPRNTELLFARPSAYDWMGLPPLTEPQYIITGALFAQPNETLRFTQRHESEYSSMWSNYPSRRIRSTDGVDEPTKHQAASAGK